MITTMLSSPRSFAGLLTVLLMTIIMEANTTNGQTIGVDLCACQPATFDFTLDFSSSCSINTVAGTPGVSESACVVNKQTSEEVTDFTPVLVTNVQFLDLDQNLQVMRQFQINGAFRNGDVVRYDSALASSPNFNTISLPRALQVTFTGVNSLDQPIVYIWAVIFNNDCGIFPILSEGQQIGLTVFVSSYIALHVAMVSF
jgi:hypothetical protein